MSESTISTYHDGGVAINGENATLSITNTGTIFSTTSYGVDGYFTSNTILNQGTIISEETSTASYGVLLGDFDHLSNAAGAIITSADIGAGGGAFGTGFEIENAGTIAGGHIGVVLAENSTLVNEKTGLVTGGQYGQFPGFSFPIADAAVIFYGGGNSTFINAGTVAAGGVFGAVEAINQGLVLNTGLIVSTLAVPALAGGNSSGIYLENGGYVSNSTTGTISSYNEGIISVRYGYANPNYPQESGTVFNAGTIEGTGSVSVGIVLNQNGDVTNAQGGVITGKFDGVSGYYDTDTISNHGLISGGSYGVIFNDVSAATIENAGTIAGAKDAIKFSGAGLLIIDPGAQFIGAVVGGPADRIELTAGHGTLTGIGSQFSDFKSIEFDAGANWLVSGNLSGLNNEHVSGFAAGSTIDVTDFAAVAEGTYTIGASDTLSLAGAGGQELTLDFTAADTGKILSVSSDGALGTDIFVICYLRGTRILTPTGEVAVEQLTPGDPVVTRWGGVQAIKWIGRQSFIGPAARSLAQIPVRIRAGALGEMLPRRDLYVSPGHSMLLGEVLVLASNLVNGVTITRGAPREKIDYYQLEFAAHDCVLAEGAWSESYADAQGMRAKFHNAAEFDALFPDYVAPAEPVLCAPRPTGGAALAAALHKPAAIAAAASTAGPLRGWIDRVSPAGLVEGWAHDLARPELPVLLRCMSGETVLGEFLAHEFRADVAAAGMGGGRCGFIFQCPALTPREMESLVVARVSDGALVPSIHAGQVAA